MYGPRASPAAMPRLEDAPVRKEITLELDGETITAREGESVATALLAAGETVFSRSVKYHRPRGPFCMAGACSHCLMRVDGVPNVYTCRTPARAGMRIERQNAYPSAEHDVFGAIDFLFPRGLDHHEMFAGVPVAQQVMQKVARHLAGLGLLPDRSAPVGPAHHTEKVQVAILGAGPAGLAAARELQQAGVEYLLVEHEESPGGRLTYGAPGLKDPPLSAFASAAGKRVRLRTTAIGLFDDQEGRFVAAVERTDEGPRLVKLYARQILVTTGGYPALWAFENNDLPGVFSGRALASMLRRDGFLPAESFALVGTGPELYDTARLLLDRGARVHGVVDVAQAPPSDVPAPAYRGEPLKAHGRSEVSGLSYKTEDGKKHRIWCDAIGVCVPASPAFELARQGGAKIVFAEAHQGFVVEADEHGRTQDPTLFVAGDLLGSGTIAKAADSGARSGRAIAQALKTGVAP